MDRFAGQRGYTRFTKLVLFLLLVAAGYLGATFWPVARSELRIKSDAQRLANRALQHDGTPKETHVTHFLKGLYEREGLVLTRSDVSLDTSDPDRAVVTVQLALPYEYPVLHQQRTWNTTLEVVAERARGF